MIYRDTQAKRKTVTSAPRLWAASMLTGIFTMSIGSAGASGPALTEAPPALDALQTLCGTLNNRGALAACHDALLERHVKLENEMLSRAQDEQEALRLKLHFENNNECVAFKYASSAVQRDKTDIQRQLQNWGQDVSSWTLTPALEHTATSMFQSGAECFDHLSGMIANDPLMRDTSDEMRALSEEMRNLGLQFTLEH